MNHQGFENGEKKMKKLIILFTFIIVNILLITGCFEKEKAEVDGKEGLEGLEGLGYINEVYMYGFNPPEGFYLKEESFFNQYVVFEYISSGDETGQLGIYIYASNISANISLPNRSIHEIARDLEDSLANTTSYNLNLDSYNYKTQNGMDFYEIILETPIGQSENYSVFWKYIYVIKDDRMINFQIISNSELYDKYIEVVDQSLNSLVIIELEEEEWDLEKYYTNDGESDNTYVMSAKEHYEDRAVVVYFSNVKIFYNTPNEGDIIIIKDSISNLIYDKISNITTISFVLDETGSLGTLYFLFEGDITNQYSAGDQVDITVTIKRVSFSYENVNYDLEIYTESWKGEEFFKENIISALDITHALKPLSSNQIGKI